MGSKAYSTTDADDEKIGSLLDNATPAVRAYEKAVRDRSTAAKNVWDEAVKRFVNEGKSRYEAEILASAIEDAWWEKQVDIQYP